MPGLTRVFPILRDVGVLSFLSVTVVSLLHSLLLCLLPFGRRSDPRPFLPPRNLIEGRCGEEPQVDERIQGTFLLLLLPHLFLGKPSSS